MASAVVVDALDTYWNPYVAQDEFTTITERLMDQHNDEYTDDVTRVNEKSADIFWRGTTNVSWNANHKVRMDRITTPAGQVLYPNFDSCGNRVVVYYHEDGTATKFTISYRQFSPVNNLLRVTMARGVNLSGKSWTYKVVDSYGSKFEWSDFGELAEQRLTYWIMAQLNKSL